MREITALVAIGILAVAACSEGEGVTAPASESSGSALLAAAGDSQGGGVITANGWYEGEEIYYILGGLEQVTERGVNQIYFIGGDRAFQSNVVLHIPGEPGYSPHWNVNVVHTSPGVTVQDLVDAGFSSLDKVHAGDPAEVRIFDDVEDILAAEGAGFVYLERPGLVVLCPIISEAAAEAPGNTELDDEFPQIPLNTAF
jgi:hypothetical protein